jgi:serine/threonine protein phosphatase PrpC
MQPRIEVGLSTDVGQVRTGNEDSVLCEPLESAVVAERGLFCAVADGMGGHAAGEVASSMAVSTTRDLFYGSADGDIAQALRSAISQANAAVYDAGAGTTGRDHMGSTLTAAVLSNNDAEVGHVAVVVGHVGDTRCYVVKRGAIQQLTRDHSWVAEEVQAGLLTEEQARVHPRRNIITRALGLRPEVDVDVYHADLEVGNMVVICSDGLHGLVTDDEILAHVTRHRPSAAVDALVRLANERGGPDNITVLVAQVVEDEADTQPGFMAITDVPTPQATPIPASLQEAISTPLPGITIEDPATTPAPIPLVNELSLDDDKTEQVTALGRDDADDTPIPMQVQSQSQTQDQTEDDPSAPDSPAVDEPVGPSTERRPVLDHLPTAAPRRPSESELATEPGLGTDLDAPSERLPAEQARPLPERRMQPAPRASRASGMGLLVVLLLLLVLGAGIGYALFQLSGLAG